MNTRGKYLLTLEFSFIAEHFPPAEYMLCYQMPQPIISVWKYTTIIFICYQFADLTTSLERYFILTFILVAIPSILEIAYKI
jgi:hypothetical protein